MGPISYIPVLKSKKLSGLVDKKIVGKLLSPLSKINVAVLIGELIQLALKLVALNTLFSEINIELLVYKIEFIVGSEPSNV